MSERRKVLRRLTLRDRDGNVFLDRWGIRIHWLGSVFLHKMSAPDPGTDLHDHPWTFVTIPLWGGYVERRAFICPTCNGPADARKHLIMERTETRRPFRPRRMRLDVAHTIDRLRRRTAWTLVITGPVRREWGFYIPRGWVHHVDYEDTPEGRARTVDWSSNYKPSKTEAK